MVDFSRLSQNVDDSTHKEILAIIGGRQSGSGMTTDSAKPIPMSPSDIESIQQLSYTRVRMNEMEAGPVQSLTEAREHIASGIAKLTVDSYYNPATGLGTPLDPTFYNSSNTPVSMMPQEASSYYSNGGIAGMIIDTKAGGMLTNGYRFLGLSPKDNETLKEYADAHNFDHKAIRDPNRDGLIFGGAMAVPSFKKDNASTYGMSIKELIRNKIIEKDCLSNIWSADRWNCVLVPDWNIAASDYLTPKHIFVPIAGVNVNTERAAIIRPKQLPYWGTIQQMGWGVSEFVSWIQPLLGYQIGVYGVPQVLQQMSLIFSKLPLDALLAAGGPNAAKALADEIGRKLASASNVMPKMYNGAADIQVIERNFSGFPGMIQVLEDAICANAELSPGIVFGRQGPGMGNDDGESTLKMSGSIQKIANKIIPQLQPIVKILVYSCFGPDSEQAKLADKVRVDFDSPVVLTNKERNEAATAFSGILTAGYGLGMQIGDVLEMGKAFIPDIELPQDVLDKYTQVADEGLNDEPGDGVASLFDRLHPEADGVGNLGASLRGDDGVGNLADKIGITSAPDMGKKMESLLKRRGEHGLTNLAGRIKGLFSKQTSDSLTFSGHKLEGRTKVHGMDISIENKKGSVRKGADKDGHSWETKMNYDYGYIRGTVGKDKDHLDVYLGPDLESEKVFIVHQNDPVTGKYDEDKCMVGFGSGEDAKKAYLKQYDRPGFFGDMVEINIDDFKAKIFDEKFKGKKLSVDSDFVESEHPRGDDGKFGNAPSSHFDAIKNPTAKKMAQGAFSELAKHHPDFPKIESRSGMGKSIAVYSQSNDKIFVSPSVNKATLEEWENQVASGHWSQSNPIAHELGHFLAAKEMGSGYDNLKNLQFSDAEKQSVEKNLSKYATRNGTEFMAEYVAGRMSGKEYPEEIDRIARRALPYKSELFGLLKKADNV